MRGDTTETPFPTGVLKSKPFLRMVERALLETKALSGLAVRQRGLGVHPCPPSKFHGRGVVGMRPRKCLVKFAKAARGKSPKL